MKHSQFNIKLTPADQQVVNSIEEKHGTIRATELFRSALYNLSKSLDEECVSSYRYVNKVAKDGE